MKKVSLHLTHDDSWRGYAIVFNTDNNSGSVVQVSSEAAEEIIAYLFEDGR